VVGSGSQKKLALEVCAAFSPSKARVGMVAVGQGSCCWRGVDRWWQCGLSRGSALSYPGLAAVLRVGWLLGRLLAQRAAVARAGRVSRGAEARRRAGLGAGLGLLRRRGAAQSGAEQQRSHCAARDAPRAIAYEPLSAPRETRLQAPPQLAIWTGLRAQTGPRHCCCGASAASQASRCGGS
jgi:hypothetical protein